MGLIVHLASRCAKDDRAKLTPQWWGQDRNSESFTFSFAVFLN